jgi:hypothetical protein
MASLSLREAAEQTGTNKVDVGCAIRAGGLPAKKTDDGGFAINPAGRRLRAATARSMSHGIGHNGSRRRLLMAGVDSAMCAANRNSK